MSFTSYFTIAQQAGFIANGLDSWAGFNGGHCQIAFDEYEMWYVAGQQSQVPRLILCYAGEQARGDFSLAARLNRVDRQWKLAVTRGRVLTQDRGMDFVASNQNAVPFYDLVDGARDIVRAMVGVSVESPVDFKEITPMTIVPDVLINAYLISFSIAVDLPALTDTPQIGAPPIPNP